LIPESFAEENLVYIQLETPFDIQINQTAFIESENLQIRLSDIQDSRCPSDVQCVWEGQVTVSVSKDIGGNNAGTFVLGTATHLNPSIQQFDKYFLQLIKVEPYPTSTEPILPSDYIVTMKLISTENLPPLKQVNNGILSADVICKEGFELIFKSTNNSPACVKAETAIILQERGWGGMAPPSMINSFEECVAAGNPVMESYPRQCRTLDGKHFVESLSEQEQCEIAGGLWEIWGNISNATNSCNPATSDAGKVCTDSSQCQSFCQANQGAQINSEEAGTCYGYELAICMQEVRDGVVDPEWCQ